MGANINPKVKTFFVYRRCDTLTGETHSTLHACKSVIVSENERGWIRHGFAKLPSLPLARAFLPSPSFPLPCLLASRISSCLLKQNAGRLRNPFSKKDFPAKQTQKEESESEKERTNPYAFCLKHPSRRASTKTTAKNISWIFSFFSLS